MATKSMAYDHPAYIGVGSQSFACAAGASAVSANKFIAFTNLIVKSVTVAVVTAGTSAGAGNAIIVKQITGQGTTTTALATATLGTNTAGVSVNVAITTNGTLAQGETLTFTNGTDATGAAVVGVEYVVVPGATVTQ